MSVQRILDGFAECISSRESVDGQKPVDLLDGQVTSPSGQDPVHASRSPSPESGKARRTRGTSGQKCSASSKTVDRPLWLGSKSLRKMDLPGSMEFVTTWKESATPAGRTIWRLVASPRRTSDSDSTGLVSWMSPQHRDVMLAAWCTPMAGDVTGAKVPPSQQHRAAPCKLKQMVQLAAWNTPLALSADGRRPGNNSFMNNTMRVLPRATPQARDVKSGAVSEEAIGKNSRPLSEQVIYLSQRDTPQASWSTAGAASRSGDRKGEMLTPGLIRSSCHAQTGRPGVLDPEFSRWLMGYREAWDQSSPGHLEWTMTQRALEHWSPLPERIAPGDCEGTETPSSPTLPPSS